ncbi:unnamed protein product [Ascophyllum nodosum]
MAGEEGLAVMSLGSMDDIADITFRNNSFFCSSGMYGYEENIDEVEVGDDTCRWGVACSRCIDQCDAPVGIDIDESSVPVCVVVPEGVKTTGNSGMTLETLDLVSGFYRTSYKSKEVLKCYKKKACMGGSNAGSYCAGGYAGPYCATCDEGYGSGFQYSCHSCQGSAKWAAIGGAIAVLVVVIFVVALGVAYLVGVVDRPTSDRRGTWERRFSNFRDGLVRAIPFTAIKIVFVSWQIITQFSGVVNVQYPPAYESLLTALSVVDLNLGSILSLSCVVETTFYTRLILATITPAAVVGALAITCRVAVLRNDHSALGKQIARNKNLAVGLFLLFMVYSSVSYTIFQTFVCDPLDSEVTYLRADYNLVCWTKTHIGYMTYAGLMILVYPVGIPAMFAWVLLKNHDRIRSYPGSTAQVAIEALLAVVFFSISEILSPFAEPLEAWLYRSGTWVIFLSIYLALLLKMDAAEEESHSQNVFGGLLIAAHVGMILIVIANTLLSALKGFREVRAVEIPVVTQNPSYSSRSALTRQNHIEFIEEKKNDASRYNSNPIFAGRGPSNIPPL